MYGYATPFSRRLWRLRPQSKSVYYIDRAKDWTEWTHVSRIVSQNIETRRKSTQSMTHTKKHTAATRHDSQWFVIKILLPWDSSMRQCSYERHSPLWTSAIIFRGRTPFISALARTMATALERLRQNHRQKPRSRPSACVCLYSMIVCCLPHALGSDKIFLYVLFCLCG
jgi:hypothetical protein